MRAHTVMGGLFDIQQHRVSGIIQADRDFEKVRAHPGLPGPLQGLIGHFGHLQELGKGLGLIIFRVLQRVMI